MWRTKSIHAKSNDHKMMKFILIFASIILAARVASVSEIFSNGARKFLLVLGIQFGMNEHYSLIVAGTESPNI